MLIFGFFCQTYSQVNEIRGTVFEFNNDQKEPLTGVNIYWAGTQKGTVSDLNGNFVLSKQGIDYLQLVVSFVGYKKDTLEITAKQEHVNIILSVNRLLEEVVITNKVRSNYISRINPIVTNNIAGEELLKAACCNLSESFETNASVDVSYSDAISGAKQIMLLGLAGIYSQIMTENIPILRGLSSTYGLGYIPGPWMESIQISKGAASVINGFESITGQINVEYKKPDKSEKIYLNALTNSEGKLEGNTNASVKLNDKWSTMISVHAENMQTKTDKNDDSFIDMPLLKQTIFFNRWKYIGGEGFVTQFGIKILDEDRIGGQINFEKNQEINSNNAYGININSKHYEAFWKCGYLFPKKVGTSFGFINSASYHERDALFGLNIYEGEQKSWYSNLIFQSIINNTNNKFSTGLSFQFDEYSETYNDTIFQRKETVPGSFFQYTYTNPKFLTILIGIRADYHNTYGVFFTPRFHIKYIITENTIIRGSLGKGYRSSNVFSDNNFLLASSRELVFPKEMKQEEAVNYGVNLTKYFNINKKEMTINLEYYRTDFINQLIVDRDQDISKIFLYNLDGKSYSNSIQIKVSYEPIKRLDIVAAYRFTDVKTTINGQLLRKPLVNRYKGLLNISYATNLKKWQFDFTALFNGDSRLPDTEMNPSEYQREKNSPVYTIFIGQVSKFYKKWSVYVGCENITNFTQDNPIIAADDPFGDYFDASLVWGPIVGRKFYIGLRYAIKNY